MTGPGNVEWSGEKSAHDAVSAVDVSVCICTYRRAHIAETIRSVLAQRDLGLSRIEIVVADDDPQLSAQSIVDELAASASIPVRCIPCGARNVATARNACLDTARGEWIAFIDDDELALPDWLNSLIAARQTYNADVVKGAVRAVYPAGTPGWIRAADPYSRDYGPTGQMPTHLATGNVLFRRALAEASRLRFDPNFGRTGGEDTDFFRRVRLTNAKIVASREAVVEEIVPIERLSLAYLSGRARRMGQVEAHKSRLGLSDATLAGNVGLAILAVTLLWAHPLLRAFAARPAYKSFAKFWYSFGVLEGVALGRHDEMI